jgi:uncharacterized membrane protein (UPF0182 family)
MPPDLRSHVRYPEDLFKVQADIFRTYHMTDPRVFYNKEDLWDTPTEGAGGSTEKVDPYYVIMRLPGGSPEEFVLIRPYTPSGKPNAVAWMGARSDGPNYGKLAIYRFPSGKQTPGPAQVESSIDAQPEISKSFSLLNVQGSHVKRGNLLMIPIDQSYLYVEPVYLAADQNPRPAVIGVVLYSGGTVLMEPTLAQSLKVALGQAVPTYGVGQAAVAAVSAATSSQGAARATASSTAAAAGTAGPAPPPAATSATVTPGNNASAPSTAGSAVAAPSATDVPGLIQEARDADARAQDRLRAGDFAGYGQEQARLRAALDRLGQLTQPPSTSPTPSP